MGYKINFKEGKVYNNNDTLVEGILEFKSSMLLDISF